ncbi:MAG: phosphotransferase [Thiolinea sp.]
MTQDVRLEQLTHWVRTQPDWQDAAIELAYADASFRRYFRASTASGSAIIMDAPPQHEDCVPFLDITERLRQASVHAPQVLARNLMDGFLMLEDLGSTLLLDDLHPDTVDWHYQQAMTELLNLQAAEVEGLPVYDEDFLRQEMELMPTWFLRTHLQFAEAELPSALLARTFNTLATEIRRQPLVFVHRDFHSRNLMLTPGGELGVIDYQDAMLGPATYDLVSLLRDCYVHWPEQRVRRWALAFHHEAIIAGNLPPVDERSFLRWFDLTGLQRHLKVLGIFSRLHHRDGKSRYLEDLPLVLSYVLNVGARHPETVLLVEWLREAGVPQRIGTVNIPG